MNRTSNLLTVLLLAFSLALVSWWTWFQVQEARRLEQAGGHLVAGRIDDAARALGAEDAASLPGLARSRRRMFLSEGLVFAAIVVAAGVVVLLAQRRQARLQADHDRFLAGATHELKTPLATIQLLLESLRDGRVPEHKRARYLESGLLEAARLEAGLTNVLTAAGLRTSEPRRLSPSEGDLAADVQQAVATLRPRAEAAGVELELPALQPVPATRDPDAIQLVLHNLLDNAVKYSGHGSHVRIELQGSPREAVLTIHDEGAGMDAETLRRAFTPFWRGQNGGGSSGGSLNGNHNGAGGTGGTGGAGLGLHLVRELVAAHGGTIEAHSDGPGRGSCFTMRLPRRGGAQ